MRCGVIIGSTIHTNFYIMRKEKEIIHIVLILSLIENYVTLKYNISLAALGALAHGL